jgi:hypothetical protein
MSIKTLRKRIALVAVSALGVGLLSVAPASAAAGAFTDFQTTTYCSAKTAALATAALTDDVRYLTVPVGAPVVVEPSDGAQILVIAGTNAVWAVDHPLDTSDGTTGPEATASADGKTMTIADAIDATDTVVAVALAVGTFTIKSYDDASDSTAADTVTVTVVSSCSTGSYSAADSFIELQGTSANANDNQDDQTTWADGEVAYLAVQANDVYGADVPIGTWIASATNGALVGIGTSTSPTCGATSVASTAAVGTNIHVAVCQGTDYAAQSTVLTLTYGSTEIAKKSILITGDVAKLEVTSVGSPKNTGAAQYKIFKTRTFDAAGNQIAWTDAKITADSATLNQDVIALDGGATVATDYASNANTATCATASKGSAKVRLKALTNTLTYVYSDVFTIQCAGTVYTWSASLDKATYVPGDIATLTITAKDVNGLPVHTLGYTANDGATGPTRNLLGGTTLHTAAGSQMTAVTALAATDYFGAGGVKTYQFTVGTTEGDYAMAVTLADYAATQAAQTIKYSVKSSSTAVTNAEVLAAIVKLIASINKQIRALQKSLKR